MKKICTYGGQPARRSRTIAGFQVDTAAACAAKGIDLISIADVDLDGCDPLRHAKAWGDVLSIRQQLRPKRATAPTGIRDDTSRVPSRTPHIRCRCRPANITN